MNTINFKEGFLIYVNKGKDEDLRSFILTFKNDNDLLEGVIKLNEKLKIKNFDNVKIGKVKLNVDNEYIKNQLKGLPEMKYNLDYKKYRKIRIYHYKSEKDIVGDKIKEILKIDDTLRAFSLIYKNRETNMSNKMFIHKGKKEKQPKYPIFIISKGRWETRKTARYLTTCGIKYFIVVEPDEKDKYIEHGEKPEQVLVMPKKWKNKQIKLGNGGGIPVRNYVHHYSKNILKTEKHWILDDNIHVYYRFYKSHKIPVYSSAVFRIVEDYSDRYENVYVSGHNYQFFIVNKDTKPIYYNTKIYSSILINNNLNDKFKSKYLWRGVYNEDVDLILRTLKLNLPTICFNYFASGKTATMNDKGGNTTTIYDVEDAHSKKTDALVNLHPDCVKKVIKFREKYKRYHHEVDYSNFKSIKLKYKEGEEEKFDKLPLKPNEYNLILKDRNSKNL